VRSTRQTMDGLIIRQPFADLIALGQKNPELRRRPIRMTGRFYVLAARTADPAWRGYDPARLGVAVAAAEQGGLIGPLSISELLSMTGKHRATVDQTPLVPAQRYRMKAGAVTVVRDVALI
jgi:hypothetical protein